jgi:hypothetical protein
MFAELLRFRSWRIAVILSAVKLPRREAFREPGPAAHVARTNFPGAENPIPSSELSGISILYLDTLWGEGKIGGEGKRFRAIPCRRRIRLQGLGPRFGRGASALVRFSLPAPVPASRGLSGSFLAMGFSRKAVFTVSVKSLVHQRFQPNFHIAEHPQVRFKVLQSPEFTILSLSLPPHCTSSSSPPCGRPALP